MSIMKDEILSQKELLINTYIYNSENIKTISNRIKSSSIKHIEIVARGSSRNACYSFKYILESKSDYRVSFIYPSTVTKYKGTLNKDTIYIAVSQGGKGEDVRMIIEEANKIGAYTIGITNDEGTPLNNVCKDNLYLKVNKENAMAATKSFTSEMVLMEMLASELSNIDYKYLENIGSLIDSIDYKLIDKYAEDISKTKTLYVISRGYSLGVAMEACCKLQETCFINAFPFASSDFMHGPLALVDENFNTLMLIPNDETKDDVLELSKLITKNNGTTFIVSNELDSNLKRFYDVFFIQLLSEKITTILNTNPDTSRNLNKYTKTI